jgi:hypothetical protein
MRLYRWCLIGTVAWGVLAFGAVYPWAYWPLAAAAAVLGIWGIAATAAWRDPRVRQLAAGLGVLATAITLQLVALPYDFVTWLSPSLDAFLRAYQLGFRPPARHALSIDPAHTAAAWGLFVALSLLALGLIRTLRRLPLEWLVGQLMGLGVALALLGIIQKGLIDDARPLVYGFWSPEQLGSPFGPFINRNHFAGWMAMVLPVVAMYAIGLLRQETTAAAINPAGRLRWLTTVDGNRVLLAAFMAVVMGTALVSTGSRSGVISLSAAALVMLAFLLPRLGARRQRLAAVVYLGAIVAGAVMWAGSDMVAARFATGPDTLDSRLSAWRDTLAIIRDFPIFGVGLGGYAQAMLLYQTESRELMYAQAHNEYVQLAAEGGLLVGVPALVVLGLVAIGIRRRLDGEDDPLTFWIRRGAVAGLVAIAVQSLVDFSLQMPGNAVLFVVVLAIALHRPRSGAHARRV